MSSTELSNRWWANPRRNTVKICYIGNISEVTKHGRLTKSQAEKNVQTSLHAYLNMPLLQQCIVFVEFQM